MQPAEPRCRKRERASSLSLTVPPLRFNPLYVSILFAPLLPFAVRQLALFSTKKIERNANRWFYGERILRTTTTSSNYTAHNQTHQNRSKQTKHKSEPMNAFNRECWVYYQQVVTKCDFVRIKCVCVLFVDLNSAKSLLLELRALRTQH